jgi:structural maintenance of chromosome 2
VRLALELVGHAPEVARAMAFVFGDTFVCDDAAAAQRVTFSPQVGGARAVTLDGDVYDPSGTLSGGAPPSGSGLLVRVQELLAAEERLTEANARLARLQKAADTGREGREKWRAMAKELEIKEHQVQLLAKQLEGSNAMRVSVDLIDNLKFRLYRLVKIGVQVEELKKTIANLTTGLESAKEKQAAAKADCRKLEKDMAEFKDNKEGKINELKVGPPAIAVDWTMF